MKRALRAVLDFVLPPRCLACGESVQVSGAVCPECFDTLEFIAHPYCDGCGVPLPEGLPHGSICPECSAHPPPYAKARAALIYKGVLHRLISRFKYHDQLQATPLLTRWMQMAGSELIREADMIVPVPLHWRRMLQRRYNQAAELARVIAKSTAAEYRPDLLKRKRYTRPQASLSRIGRARNVKGAFALRRAADKAIIKNKTILLVDDVMTTGATISVCAKALKRAGAKKVLVLTVARTTLEG